MIDFIRKQNIFVITFLLISNAFANNPLFSEHTSTPGEGLYYRENKKTNINSIDRFDNKGDEYSSEFGPLAKKNGRYYECKDGRSISDKDIPLGPSEFFESHNYPLTPDIDLKNAESVLLFTKKNDPNPSWSLIEIPLKRKIDIKDLEKVYLVDYDKTEPYMSSKYSETRTVVYIKKNKDQSVKIRYSSSSPKFIDQKGKEYSLKTILKGFRIYCPLNKNQLHYRGAAFYKFGYFVNKYGERMDRKMPNILITSSVFLNSGNYPDVKLPSF